MGPLPDTPRIVVTCTVFAYGSMSPRRMEISPQALASWGRCLAPGGVAVVVLWPSRVEREGPWAAFDQVRGRRRLLCAGLGHCFMQAHAMPCELRCTYNC